MKLCRFGDEGSERPAMVAASGELRDLSGHLEDIDPRVLSPEGLARLAAIDPATLPLVEGSPRLGPPWSGASKFICIGLNYADHAAESGMPIPSEPVIFSKATTAICGPADDVMQPINCTQLDWEVELGVVIGTTARSVDERDALRHVAGYCVVNDISERAFQMQSSQWDKGKGCDTFGPLGPWLVTADEVEDPQALELWLEVNGERMQTGNTRTMIFGVAELVSYVSRYMTLLPGDVISTGTPPGVALGQASPRWLQPGDVMELGIAGLGVQRQQVVAYRGRP